jgi:hypothetical protein
LGWYTSPLAKIVANSVFSSGVASSGLSAFFTSSKANFLPGISRMTMYFFIKELLKDTNYEPFSY